MSQTDVPQNSDQPVEEEVYPRAAPIMVGVTFILFLAMMALLGYRWLKMGEPNGFILVQGSKNFSGAEAAVSDVAGEAESHGILSAGNDYRLRFPLPQGIYQFRVTLNDQPIVKESVSLREGSGVVFNLDKQATAATQPSGE